MEVPRQHHGLARRVVTTGRPTHYAAGVIVERDVIEGDGQPWRVVSAHTTPELCIIELKHARYPHRTRTIRPKRATRIRVLYPRDADV
jgi:hypothetical protein